MFFEKYSLDFWHKLNCFFILTCFILFACPLVITVKPHLQILTVKWKISTALSGIFAKLKWISVPEKWDNVEEKQKRFRWNKILHVRNNLVPFCPFSVYKQRNINYRTVSPWRIIYYTISENGWREKKCVSHNWVAINLASRRTHFTQIVSTGMCGA